MLTRKNFQALADTMKGCRPDIMFPDLPPVNDRTYWEAIVDHVAWFCAEQNPRFDRDRFMKAAGVRS